MPVVGYQETRKRYGAVWWKCFLDPFDNGGGGNVMNDGRQRVTVAVLFLVEFALFWWSLATMCAQL